MTNPPTNRRRLCPKTTLLATLSAVFLVLPLGALRLPGQNIRAKFNGAIDDPSGAGPVGGEVQAAKLITKAQPEYPAGPKAVGVEGAVLLHAIIGVDGSPLSLRVINEVDPELARAAVEAVKAAL
jgi:hypothetical protein